MESKKGVTLFELLLTMVLITVLSGFAISYLSRQTVKGRDAKRKAAMSTVQTALELYRSENNFYPTDNSGVIVGCGTYASPTDCAWGSQWLQSNAAGNPIEYMKKLPIETKTGWSYYYKRHATNNQKYYLCAKLENTGDPDYQASAPDCAGYNYEVTDP